MVEPRKRNDLHTASVTKAYDAWAPIYDLVFGKVFARGRLAAVNSLGRAEGRLLEVGVGTGLSLPAYPETLKLVGVDISEPMLAKARERVRTLGLKNVEALTVMDAEKLEFDHETFDFVVAQYVVTAVPHPEVALDELLRVTKPGGEIILTSRIGAETGLRGAIEKTLSPFVNKLGWRTEFPWSRYQLWAERAGRVRVIEQRPLPPLGHFSLIRFVKLH